MADQPLMIILCQILLFIYIRYIRLYHFVSLGFMAYKLSWLFNAKSSFYIYINYMIFEDFLSIPP